MEGTDYHWADADLNASHLYLLPVVLQEMEQLRAASTFGNENRVFELGCGNGSVGNVIANNSWDVTGVDPSNEGIALANKNYPNLKLYSGSAYENLATQYGQFNIVTSLEVVEHLYSPRIYAATLYSLVRPGGVAIVSTPYHGYIKNLVLAISGKLDEHFTALWDNGHIKFWSVKTLTRLLKEAGFDQIRFIKVGRVPCVAKSMIAIAKKP